LEFSVLNRELKYQGRTRSRGGADSKLSQPVFLRMQF